MAIGTTHNFILNRDQILDQALALVGAVGPGRTGNGNQRTHAAKALNAITKAWDAHGTLIHRLVRKTLSTTDGTAQYTLDSQAIDVEGPMTYLPSGETTRTLIHPYTGEDYMHLSDRTLEGTPQFYFLEWTEPGVLKATFWPIPDTTSDTIEYRAELEGFDFDDGDDDPDYPVKWVRALYFAVAADIAPAYNQTDRAQAFMAIAEQERDMQLASNNEKAPLVISPFGNAGMY